MITSSFEFLRNSSTAETIVVMLLLEISTPLGSPVVPLVYIIVHMSSFSFGGSSYFSSPPYWNKKKLSIVLVELKFYVMFLTWMPQKTKCSKILAIKDK
jgi:hypothetical protein